jgi:hypothetical protein
VPRQPYPIERIDVNHLNRVLNAVNFSKARKRRALYNRLYQEALVTQEESRGISFSNMLLLLAHYKIIDDEKALQCALLFCPAIVVDHNIDRVDETLRRNALKSTINTRVNVDRVRSMLRMVYLRRRFKAWKEEQRQPALPLSLSTCMFSRWRVSLVHACFFQLSLRLWLTMIGRPRHH